MQAVMCLEVGTRGGGVSPAFCDFVHFFLATCIKKETKNEKEKEHTHTHTHTHTGLIRREVAKSNSIL